MNIRLILCALFAIFFTQSAIASSLDFSKNCPDAFENGVMNFETLENCLKADGVLFEVHGIVPMSSMFVISYRNPKNFFETTHLSLLGATKRTRDLIKTLKRHDVIRVKGEYESEIHSPQKHVRALEIEVVKPSNTTHTDTYQYEAIPDDLLKMDHFVGKVHAVYAEGAILVVEYKDLAIPVFVKPQFTSLTKSLYRGDKIEVNYSLQPWPKKPTHLNLDESMVEPLKVLRSTVANHGKKVSYTGKLILFPKSPMVSFDVYAIDVDLGDAVMLPHTVLSFTDVDLFKAAREKFAAAWKAHPNGVREYRNKFLNEEVSVTVSGTYNMVDPGQANPQIVIEKIEDITIH